MKIKIYNDLVFYWYAALYCILALTSLNFNYVEGDDASTILYHLMGRDKNIQEPYSLYHSGFDFVLSFLPLDESFLRIFSIIVSFIFGFIMLYVLRLITIKISKFDNKLFWLLFPFVIPDILFHSLIYNPTNVSFTFVLLSLNKFLDFEDDDNYQNLFWASVLFSFGFPFRWSILMMIFTILSILIFKLKKDEIYKISEYYKVSKYFILSGLFSLVTLFITGYTIIDFFEVFIWGKQYNESADRSVLSMFSTGLAFFTPSLLILTFVGSWNFFKNDGKLKFIIMIFILLFPFLLIGFFPSFKFAIHLIPVILILSYYGFKVVYEKTIRLVAFSIIVIIPWLFGVNIDATGLSYGPGFYSKDCLKEKGIEYSEKNVDHRISISEYYITSSGGMYMPTLEGPRPLYGYFSVLFLGEWKREIQAFYEERKKIYDIIRDNDFDVFYFQDRKTAYFQCDLFRNGMICKDSFLVASDDLFVRKFKNESGKKIDLYVARDKRRIVSIADSLIENHQKNIIFRSSYSSLINEVRKNKKYICLGTYSTISD